MFLILIYRNIWSLSKNVQENPINDVQKKYCWFLLGANEECVEFTLKNKKLKLENKRIKSVKITQIMLQATTSSGKSATLIRPTQPSPKKNSVFLHAFRLWAIIALTLYLVIVIVISAMFICFGQN